MLFHPSKNPVELRVIHLNKSQEQRREDLMEATQGKAALKQLKKTMAKKAKQALKVKSKSKNKKNNGDDKQQVFVLDFDGDIKATAVKHLREEISTLISTANKGDEVVVRLESGGGLVRSEEHTSELQSRENLVCRLLLEKKKFKISIKRRHL